MESDHQQQQVIGLDRAGIRDKKHIFSFRDRFGNPISLWIVAVILMLIPAICAELPRLRMENSIAEWLPSNDPHIRALTWFEQEFSSPDSVIVTWDSSRLQDPRVEQLADKLRDLAALRQSGITKVTTPKQVLDRMEKGRVSNESAMDSIAGVIKGASAMSPVAVIVEFDTSMDATEDCLTLIRNRAHDVGIPPTEIHLAGGLVTRQSLNKGVRSMQWNRDASWWQWYRLSPNGMSVICSSALALYLLKSWRITVLVLFVSVYTAAITTTLIPLTGGSLNMVLVVLPTLLIVLTLSGAIHLANYWKHTFSGDATAAASRAFHAAAIPCTLAVATTAIGMLSLVTSDLKPVRDFGLFSAVGVTLSLGMTLFGLPALLILSSGTNTKLQQQHPEKREHKHWRRLAVFLTRHHRFVAPGCVLLSLFATSGLFWFRTETKLIRFFDQQTAIARDYEFIEQNICGLVPIEIAIIFPDSANRSARIMEKRAVISAFQDRLKESPEISGTLSLADFFPQIAIPSAEVSSLQRLPYTRTVNSIRKLITNRDSSVTEFACRVNEPLVPPLGSDLPDVSKGSEVWRIKAFSSALTNRTYSSLVAEIQQNGLKILQAYPGARVFVTGSAPLFLKTQEAVLDSMINSFGMAFVLIQIVLFVQLKGLLAGCLAMLPNVLPVGFVFGIVSWLGVPIDIGSMLTASVALGIAIDGTVHLLNWFENGIRDGLTRNEAAIAALVHSGPPMMHTTCIICSGLLMLTGADLLLVSRFGWLLAALVFAALIGDIIYLPALLQGKLGQLIQQRIEKSHCVAARPSHQANHQDAEWRSHREAPKNAAIPEAIDVSDAKRNAMVLEMVSAHLTEYSNPASKMEPLEGITQNNSF